MKMHIHSARKMFGWILGVSAVLTPLVLAVPFGLTTSRAALASVSGRVSLDGHPAGDMQICFDSGGDHIAQDWVRADGSFHLYSRGRGNGAIPGRYRVHLLPKVAAPSIPSKYRDSGTSGLDVEVAPDWNDFAFDLH
jgi:hypothetical protein